MGGWKTLRKKVFEMLSGGFDKIAKYGTYAEQQSLLEHRNFFLNQTFGSFDPEDLDPDLQPEDSE